MELSREHLELSHSVETRVISLQRDFIYLRPRFYYFGEDVLASVRLHTEEIQAFIKEAVLN